MQHNSHRYGFSLVELSIVLVILGLLVGGILAGQSLIRASELRSVSNELVRESTALRAFQDKYMALPGDMANAVKFWGAQAGGTVDGVDATCAALDSTSPANGTATCNGNGDSSILDNNISGTVPADAYEQFRVWQHLANAGMIEGKFTGVTGSGNFRHSVVGQNVPAFKIANAGSGIQYFPGVTAHATKFNMAAGNWIATGITKATGANAVQFLKPEEQWNIDTKMDDGSPATGRMITFKPAYTYSTNCADASTQAAQYKLAYTDIACQILYLPQ